METKCIRGLLTLKVDQRKYKFTGIVDNQYDQKIERKSKPIIVANHKYMAQTHKKDQPGIKMSYLETC